MGIINVLDTQVANLIAAGEVVERPASAIKELLENSIDAGASKITVEIKNGGVSLMRITDNGCGMSKEDALVCTMRHATSKVQSASDLNAITTLGFRGEALAAISSVSKMRIMTRCPEDELGVVVECNAGQIISVDELPCPLGTTIVVEELFANVPARRKFLKRDASESAAVSAVVEKIALSRPDIAIKFIVDGAIKFATQGDNDLHSVIYAVLGRELAKKVIPVDDKIEGIEVKGFIGTPENCRGNRNYENFFINGRYVKCQTALAATEQAFSSYIPSDKFPFCVLFLTIFPAYVDVNVHPQKLEVKFSNDRPVFNAVYSAVRNVLVDKISRPNIDPKERISGGGYNLYSEIISAKTSTPDEALIIANERDMLGAKYEQIALDGAGKRESNEMLRENSDTAPVRTNSPASFPTAPMFKSERREFAGIKLDPVPDDIIKRSEEKFKEAVGKAELDILSKEPYTAKDTSVVKADPNGLSCGEDTKADAPWFRIAGVAFNCYVFVELEDKMLIIDKHAAHERLLFEKMRDNMRKENPASQILLFPAELSLTSEEYAAACEYRDELCRVGFDFTSGEENNTCALLLYPSGLNEGQARDMFTALSAALASGHGSIDVERELFYEKALYQASCKAAVKGGRVDMEEDIRYIAEQVLTNPRIKYCPHGRPVAFEMTKGEFERQFERS